MNSCILMAEITQTPELRYTSDTQTPIAEMVVQFPGSRPEDPPATLKVVGWGNMAQEIQEKYKEGDRVVIEGRLSMNTIDRPEGFKEKRAELTVQRIHSLGLDTVLETSPSAGSSMGSQAAPAKPSPTTPTARSTTATFQPQPQPEPLTKPAPSSQPDFDEIPF